MGMTGRQARQFVGYGLLADATHPVDDDRCAIGTLMEQTRSMGGQLQHGRTAQSPMGDKQGATRTIARTGDRDSRVGHYRSHEASEGVTGQAKAEERGHRGLNGQRQTAEHVEPGILG